jgi:hypothetical protein
LLVLGIAGLGGLQRLPGNNVLAFTQTRVNSGADGLQSGGMERCRLGLMQRESTAEMAANIDRELRELGSVLARCRGDRVAEPKVTAALLAHLLISSRELLQNLLIDTAQRPVRLGSGPRQEKSQLG